MRWVGLGVCVAAAVGCRGLGGGEPLTAPGAVDAATNATNAPPGPSDAAPRATGVDGGDDAETMTADGGGAPLPLCPALEAPDAGAEIASGGWNAPTIFHFPCNPVSNVFFFPRPAAPTPGAFARCASYADARVTALAVSSDGSRAALLGIDGIARIVDLASQTVVGVLAPPRASVGLVAFSPTGDTILTLARGERLVTLWRADTFAPIWTTTLPGHSYEGQWTGAAAFSPDGTSALISPGQDLYLLDVATGVIRTPGFQDGRAVLSAAYGWNGRRIALLTAPVTGMCNYSPHGGSVTILDPTTLSLLATPMTWPLLGDEEPGPGEMWVASGADLIVTRGSDSSPGMEAFRISDGTSLSAPALPNYPFPLALTPDGTAALIAQSGALQLIRLADGTVAASTAGATPTAVAISADGSTIVAGSSGDNLLGTWRPAAGPLLPTCSAELRPSQETLKTSLSADGATIAVDWGSQIRVLRRADGATLSTIAHGDDTVMTLSLSPDAQHLLGEFYDPAGFPLEVFRTSDGMQVADLGTEFSFEGGSWGFFAFLRDGRRLDGALEHTGQGTLMQIDLDTGRLTPGPSTANWLYLLDMSGACPLLLEPNPPDDASMTLTRACVGCQPLPLVPNTTNGVVSLDSTMYLSQDGGILPQGTTLWNIGSAPGVVRTYPPRPEAASFDASETPVAVSAHGERVITGAFEETSCPSAPGFTARVHDVATDTVIDDLPPGITSTSADLNVVAFGPVVWCAR